MRRALLFLLAVILGVAAAAVLLPPLPFTCPSARRLDRLLGGGPPVCLGGKASQLERYDEGAADRATCRLVQRTPRAEYQYAVRHPEAPCRRWNPVVTGCVTLRAGPVADSLARAATARLGGTWRLTLIADPQGMTEKRWVSGEGLEVSVLASFDGSRTVCARDPTATW